MLRSGISLGTDSGRQFFRVNFKATSTSCEVAFFIPGVQMKQQIGFLMQLFVLGGLPVLIFFQLMYGFRLIVMPTCLLAGIVLFTIGTRLRES